MKAKIMSEFFPVIQLKGNPHDIGLAHGRALAGPIKKNLDLYYSMVRGLNGLNPEQCLGHAAGYLKTMKADAPVLLEEMEGIAVGPRFLWKTSCSLMHVARSCQWRRQKGLGSANVQPSG